MSGCENVFCVCVVSDRLKVWDPTQRTYRSISGYGNLSIDISSKVYVTEGGAKAILLSGSKHWHLEMD